MKQSLKDSAVSAVKWNAIVHIGQYSISFGLSIILARLLKVEEFGLLGMLSIFTALAMVFINSGLSTAIIRSKNATADDYSTVFYFNIFVSAFFYLLLFFLAPAIADFYKEHQLISLTRWISLVFLINSSGIIQNALLVKEINFKQQTICHLSGLAISAVIAAIMAFQNFGVYSIVGQAISQAFVTNFMLWVYSDWRPTGIFRMGSFKKLWSFSSKILATNLVSQLFNNIDNILIGKVFSAEQLGFYVRAKSTKQLPEQIFTGILSSTSFAVLAKYSDNKAELRRLNIHFYKLGSYFYIPVILGFIAIAKPFIVLLYSEKWLPSVSLFQMMAVASIAYFLSALFSQTIMALGEGKLYFRLNSAKRILGLFTIPIGLYWGLIPFIWMIVLISYVNLILDYFYVGKLIGIKMLDYIRFLALPFVGSVFMAFVVFTMNYLPINSKILLLLLQIPIGIFIYISFSSLFRIPEYFYLKNLIKDQLKNYFIRFGFKKSNNL